MHKCIIQISIILTKNISLQVENISLITADEGLYRAVKSDLKWVKWLGDV